MVLPLRMRRSMSKTSVFTSPGAGTIEVSSEAPSPETISESFSPPEPISRQIVVEPVGQRGVDIADVAGRIDREEAARRMIEIFDRVLQFLEDVFLPLAVAGDVGDRPHRVFRLRAWPSPSGRTRMRSQRPWPPSLARDADFFLLALAFARRFQQAEHRLRHIGIADEDALDRANILRRSPRRSAPDRRHWNRRHGRGRRSPRGRHRRWSAMRLIDRIVGRAVGKAHDAGGKGEQRKQADHRQHGQQRRGYRAARGRARASSARPPTATSAAATSSTRMMLPRRAGSWTAVGSGGGSLWVSADIYKSHGLSGSCSAHFLSA